MKLSLFTVSYAGFWGQHRLSIEDAVRKAAELGYEGVELMGKRPHLSPLDWSLEDCQRLKRLLDDCGVKLSAIAGYTNFTGGGEAPEVPTVELQIAYVEQLSQRAQVLGGDLVRIFTSYERNDIPVTTQWFQTVGAIQECCDRAAQYGVSVGVQNHHDIGVTTKSFAELIRQVNRTNIVPMYDCWCVDLRGEDLAAGVRQMADQMRFTTVADYVTLPRSQYQPPLVNYRDVDPPLVIAVPMGEGELDYSTFFSELKKANFNGWVSYEMCSPIRDGKSLESLDAYASRFVEHMQEWK
jgi:sugar phosphate isomerase/epimerase